MRKALPILLVLLLVALGALPVFAGGKQEKGAGVQTITVLMGIDAAGKNMGARATEFEAQTGIKVNLVELEWDAMVNKQAVALTANEPTFDIVDCGSFMLPEYVPSGRYADISDLFPPDVKAKYMPGMIESVTIDGKVYAAPLMASWTIMFYNGEMFQNVGLDPNKAPTTWDELVSYGKKLQSRDTYAYADSFAQGEQASCAFYRWAKSAGAQISGTQGGKVKWMLDAPEVQEASRFVQRMFQEGTMDPGSPTYFQQQISDLFGKGHSAMLVNWDMMQLTFKDPEQTPYAGKIRTAPMPGRTAALVGGSIEGHEYMAIPTASRNKEAAKKFIKFISSVENEKRRAVEQGMTPVWQELFDDPAVQKVLDLDTIFKSAANCYYRPAIPEYQQCSDIISAEIQNVLVHNKDVNQALRDANAKANQLLGW